MTTPTPEQAAQARAEFYELLNKYSEEVHQLAEGFNQATLGGVRAADVLGGDATAANVFSRAMAMAHIKTLREQKPPCETVQAQVECFMQGMITGIYLCELGRASLILRKSDKENKS